MKMFANMLDQLIQKYRMKKKKKISSVRFEQTMIELQSNIEPSELKCFSLLDR